VLRCIPDLFSVLQWQQQAFTGWRQIGRLVDRYFRQFDARSENCPRCPIFKKQRERPDSVLSRGSQNRAHAHHRGGQTSSTYNLQQSRHSSSSLDVALCDWTSQHSSVNLFLYSNTGCNKHGRAWKHFTYTLQWDNFPTSSYSLGGTWKRISLPDITDMSALEVSSFYVIAPYKSTFTYLLTYYLPHQLHITCITVLCHFNSGISKCSLNLIRIMTHLLILIIIINRHFITRSQQTPLPSYLKKINQGTRYRVTRT